MIGLYSLVSSTVSVCLSFGPSPCLSICPHNALHNRFEIERKKGRQRLRRIDNIKTYITWADTKSKGKQAIDLTGSRTMEVIYSYPSSPKGWRQELGTDGIYIYIIIINITI